MDELKRIKGHLGDYPQQYKDVEFIENQLKVLDIIKKHLSIVNPVNCKLELFDIDLWNDGKQKEEFKLVKKALKLKSPRT